MVTPASAIAFPLRTSSPNTSLPHPSAHTMTRFIIGLSSWCFVLSSIAAGEEPRTKNKEPGTEVYRPEPGKFPDLEKAHSYRGELVFVDHVNRRGSVRVQGA